MDELRGEFVAMVQAAESRMCDQPRGIAARRQRPTVRGRLLGKAEVRSIIVVVVDVLTKEPVEVTLAEHNDVIEELSTDAAYPAFGDAVLPGREVDSLLGNSYRRRAPTKLDDEN